MDEPIRILQVVTYMGRGGLETMLMNYYRHMDRSRVQFDFLTHRQEKADYDDEIEHLGGKIYHLPRLVPWSMGYRRALNQFFQSHPEYRIVHVHQDCLSSVILKAAQHNGVPVRIAHSHNSSQDKDIKYPVKLFYKRFIPRYATQLFACGEDAGRWMFGGADFRILQNAIDVSAYQFHPEKRARVRSALRIPEENLVLGHVGRFSPPKNHLFLLDVFSSVHSQNSETTLLLVGDGELRPQIEQKIQDLGLGGSVILTGVRSDVPDLLQAMDLFVFPSLYEGLPVTLVEAQASGLPCMISSQIPGDCDLTALIHRISLKDDVTVWADKILETEQIRPDTSATIIKAGFDIVQKAKWLQNYYLEQWSVKK